MRFFGFLLVLVVQATAVSAQGWEARVAAARAKAAEIEAYADGFGFDYNNAMGRMARWSDADKIQCAVLAEMIGLEQALDRIEYFLVNPYEDVPMPAPGVGLEVEQADKLLRYAWGLGSWAQSAEELLALSDDQRAELWELSCNGQHGIPDGLLPEAWNKTATFRLDGTTLYVLGDITPGFFSAFKEMVAENEVTQVALGSRGGSVQDAMQAGGLIRQLELDVSLYGDCESACPLMFFAGSPPRVLWYWPLYRLGFHQVSNGATAIPATSPIYETIGAYVAAMGVDADFVLAAMQSAPPDEMHFPNWQLYCDAGIAVAVFEQCNWPYRD